jgi:dipeptidyl aminopeptidase/acylaminoacyl peptidase
VTQFLVSRGYVVFQPNFRGSTGYGFDYMRAARGEYADGRVHQDVLDGVDHLLERGLGDPRRVAIVGHSFGGYAVLGALAWSPRRFRAGVAMAPPIDLVRALRDLDEDVTLPNGLPLRPLLEDLLADVSDPRAVADLRSRSPEARLAATERPLLVVAAGRDHLVDRVDVEHYALALDELGRDVSLLMDDDQGHHFESRLMRRATLYLLQTFLAHHLESSPGPAGPPADRRLAAYLAYNLRLVGDGFGVLTSVPKPSNPGG